MLSRLLLFVLMILLIPAQGLAAPRVVVSIAPIHSLVAGVMAGVATPELLVGGARSPHRYLLKPSQRRLLSQADLIVWVGKGVESFLPKTLSSLNSQGRVLALMALEKIKLLPARRGGEWLKASHAGHHHGGMDGHLWLDPQNAKVMVNAVADELIKLDAENAERYRTNARDVLKKLDLLDAALKRELSAVKNRPYLVFHDAYQYFEARYGLNAIAAISVDPERKPGARRINAVRLAIRQNNVNCVFREPQFSSAAVRVVTEGTGAKSAVLDPMGAELLPGQDLYFQLMHRLADGLAMCLSQR